MNIIHGPQDKTAFGSSGEANGGLHLSSMWVLSMMWQEMGIFGQFITPSQDQ